MSNDIVKLWWANLYSLLPYSHSFWPDTNSGFVSISGQSSNRIHDVCPISAVVWNENHAQPSVDLHRDQQDILSSTVSEYKIWP